MKPQRKIGRGHKPGDGGGGEKGVCSHGLRESRKIATAAVAFIYFSFNSQNYRKIAGTSVT